MNLQNNDKDQEDFQIQNSPSWLVQYLYHFETANYELKSDTSYDNNLIINFNNRNSILYFSASF